MPKARILKSGKAQLVRLPKKFHFEVDEIEILRRGDEVILRVPRRNLSKAFDALASLAKDFMASGRKDPKPQKRSSL